MPTLLQMRTDSLREADLLDTQIDATDVNSILNGELAALHEILCEEHEGWIRTDATVTITAGTDEVSVPADFYRVIDVTDLVNPSTPISLRPFEFRDRHLVTQKRFCIDNGKMMVRPTSVAPGSYTLSYQPQYATLAADGDTFTAPNNWTLYAVLGTAIRMRGMQELSSTALEQRRADVGERIKAAAAKRKGQRKARDVRWLTGNRRLGKDWGYNP